MSELGQYLKEVREEKQISLDSLQGTTKIQKRYLLAIEEGRFDTLPGLFYARAFVKTYADSIGLNGEEILETYKNELPNPQREAVDLPSRSERVRQTPDSGRRKKNSVLPALIGIIVLILIVAAIWMIAQKGTGKQGNVVSPAEEENLEADFNPDSEIDDPEGAVEDDEENNKDDDEVDETDEPSNDDEEGEADSEGKLTLLNSEGNTSFYQLENGKLDQVRMEFSGDTYIDVKNGSGEMLYSNTQKAGDEVRFEELGDEKEVVFNFGASQYATLYIAEEKLEFPLDQIHQKIAITIAE